MNTYKIAVIGSGYMGGGIAQALALAGHAVTIADVSVELTTANHSRLLEEAAAFAANGLFPVDAVERISANLYIGESVGAAVRDVDFVEEAVPERIEIKHATLAEISSAAPPEAVIGSNTSTIEISKLATAVTNPERFLGVHFSNPAPFIPGVELIPHDDTSTSAIEFSESIVASVGKQSARVKDSVGFVLNRLQYALFHEASQIVEEGVATAEDIDTIVRTTFGFRLPFFGPFAIADMAGLDVYKFCYASLQSRWPERFATPTSLSKLVDAGKLGTKTGAGYLDVPRDSTNDLIAYRNNAYVRMQNLINELGPAPLKNSQD